MLGGFFFLCRWSRDLVVRSCSVSLTINFRDRESSKFCNAEKNSFVLALFYIKESFNMIAIICLFSPSLEVLLRFTFGMTCLCLTPFCFLRERRHEEWVRWTEAFEAVEDRASVDGMSEVRLVWLSDFLMRCQSVMKSSVAPGGWEGWRAENEVWISDMMVIRTRMRTKRRKCAA